MPDVDFCVPMDTFCQMSSGEKFTLICPCAILLHKLLSLLKSSLDACEDSGVVQRLVDSGI